jgi:hypothetical protein
MGMKRHRRRWAGGVYLAMGVVGSVAAVIGVVGSSRLLNLVWLQQEGKCDYLPCADDSTYYLTIGLAVIGVAGIALAATTFIHWFASRA